MAVDSATWVLGSAPATTPSKAEVGRDTKGPREVSGQEDPGEAWTDVSYGQLDVRLVQL